jgi:branched-chain amino acid aminotransferase
LSDGGPREEERHESSSDDVLRSADEVFITSSTRDVHPVVRVDEHALEPGPVTARLSAEFHERARAQVDP